MGRSGTSATARLLQAAGLDVGRELMEATSANPLGFFEDLRFFELDRDLVKAGLAGEPDQRPRWAFADGIDPARLEPFRAQARALLDERAAAGVPWGFKDPRAVMLLDFYDELAPEARFLFVYRQPWDVLDSLMRVKGRPFAGRAGLALRTWEAYNRALLGFAERHPERCALVHCAAVGACPEAVIHRVNELLGDGPLSPPAREVFDPGLLSVLPAGHALRELVEDEHPELVELLGVLEQRADLSSAAALAPATDAPVSVSRAGDLALDVVRVDGARAPAAAANAGVATGDEPLVCVLFDGEPRDGVLEGAVGALEAGAGAVLLAPGTGDPPGDPEPVEPGMLVEAPAQGLGLVTRRSLWAELGGFPADVPPSGFDGWAFAVAAASSGVPLLRTERALEAEPGDASGAEQRHVRQVVLAAHPEFAVGELTAGLQRAELWMEGYREGVDAYRRAYEEECRARETAEEAAADGRRGRPRLTTWRR